jgi:hypothetical protein
MHDGNTVYDYNTFGRYNDSIWGGKYKVNFFTLSDSVCADERDR